MATFTVKIDTGSAAFGDETGIEIAVILRGIADDVEGSMDASTSYLSSPVRDTKGNTVGEYVFKK
ncbi:MAG: hypothetical protein WBF73_22205 [Bradyrhizobium sp.]